MLVETLFYDYDEVADLLGMRAVKEIKNVEKMDEKDIYYMCSYMVRPFRCGHLLVCKIA